MRICSIAEPVIAREKKTKVLCTLLCFIGHNCLLFMTVDVILTHKWGCLFCKGVCNVVGFSGSFTQFFSASRRPFYSDPVHSYKYTLINYTTFILSIFFLKYNKLHFLLLL